MMNVEAILKSTTCRFLSFFLLSGLFLLPKVNAQEISGKIAQERLQAQQKVDSLWGVKNILPLKMGKSKSLMQTLSSGTISLLSSAEYGSIEVNRNDTYSAYTPEELVRNIFLKGGGCASVSNIEYRGHGWDGTDWTGIENRGLGYFYKGGTSVFDMGEGLVLSTGGLQSIEGPNNSASGITGPSSSDVTGDNDLQSLITQGVTNVSVLEFDFVPTGNTVQFRYIFASEEYSYYANMQYNDVFGFFISGPGITGNQNIATLPTTETSTNVVSINNVNDGSRGNSDMLLHNCPELSVADAKNSYYYINIPGSFSTCKPVLTESEELLMLSTQLNGRTKILTATYTVTPCETYHLKFAVGNVSDQAYQSAVFLEARSFDSGDEMVNFGNGIEGMEYLYRGCTNNKFRITRPTPDPFPVQVMLSYEGSTAVQGLDIVGLESGGLLPTSVEIPAGSTYVDVPYSVPAGPTGYKYLDVTLVCPCDDSALKKRLHIYDRSPDHIFQVSTTPSCPGVNSGRINAVIAVGGSGHYETSLNGTTWQSSILGYSNLAPGSYTVYLRDEGSCYQVARTAVITEATANAGANQSSCDNTFTMDAAPLNSGESGTWTVVSGAATITYPSDPKSPVTVTTAPARLRWTLNTGLCTVNADVTLTVLPKPTVTAISGPNSVCTGSKISLTNSTLGGTWTSSNIGVATVNSSTGEVTGVSAGAATITYTVKNSDNCSDSATKSIMVNTLPTVNPITGLGEVCVGSTIPLTTTTTGGTWTSSNTGVATVNSATGDVVGVSAGTAIITYTKTVSGCTGTASKTITVNALPTVNPITGLGEVCVGSTIPLATTTTGGTWTSSNTGVATVNSATGDVAGVSAGTAVITYTKTVSGCIGTASKAVTVNALPTVGEITGSAEVCENSTITLSSTPIGGAWTSSNTAVATVTSAGVVTGKTAGTTTITYTVTNTKGCVQSKTKTITVNALPTVGEITGSAEVCENSTITLSSTPIGGAWTSSNTAVATITSAGVVTGKTAGTTTITYTVTNTKGCVQSKTKTIMVNALPNVSPITGPTPMAVCVDGTLQLNNATPGGVWTSSSAAATVNSSGVVTGKSTGTATIAYTVTNSTTGCSQSATVEVTIKGNPILTINNTSVNEGGILVFTVIRTGDACSPQNYSVKYQTIDGTATTAAPADYVATSGTLTFLPSESTKTISVQTNADDIVEGEEYLTLRLYEPENCVLSGGAANLDATGRINDITDGTIMVEKYKPTTPDITASASEPSTDGSFRIRFANPNVTCVKNVKVDYVLSGATLNTDYTVDTTVPNVTTSTATIPKGLNHIEVPIKVVNNFIVEGTRTLKINISNPVLMP